MILEHLLLSDKGIRSAVDAGKIKFSVPINDDQFQPASFDVRIGRVHVYDNDARHAMHAEIGNLASTKGFSFDDSILSERFAKVYADEKDIPIILPPHAYAEIFLHEQISTEYAMSFELRSSRGRLGIAPQSLSLKDDVASLKGQQYMAVVNNSPNTYILRGHSKFAQLFFHPQKKKEADGHWETDPVKVAELFPDFQKSNMITYDGRLVFTVGDTLLRMRTLPQPLDTAQKMPEELYEKVDIKDGYTLYPNQFCVVPLLPRITCKPKVGVRLLARNNEHDGMRLIDAHQQNAAWIDPGYDNSITCHPIRRGIPQWIEPGMPFVTGQVYVYDAEVNRSYGTSALGSHYSGNNGGLVGSKS